MASLENLDTELKPVEYLARSPSRFRVLHTINEGPQTRQNLKELSDISRVTLSRMLSKFEDLGWIEQTNGEYEITPEGSYVATELVKLLRNMTTLNQLDGAMDWLPVTEFDFDLSCLNDATVTTSDWGDHTAQIRRVADVIRGSERIIATASGVSREVVEAIWHETVNSDAYFEGLLDNTAIDIVTDDPELRRQHREMLERGNTDLLRYEGDAVPLLMVSICDDIVILCGHDEDGPPPWDARIDR